jgi:Protein of unknown function (DUF2510)
MAIVEGRPPPTSQTPAPGWYPNPQGEGLRWWDGSRWTEHVHSPESAPAEPAEPGRYPLRYALLDRWPFLLGGAVAIAAIAVVAVLVLGGDDGASSGGPQEQAVTKTVDGFLGAVADADEKGCRRYIDANAEAMKRYLRLARGVPGSGSTCGFVGATGERVATLSVAEVTVKGDEATVTLEGNPTVMHLSDSGGRWVIDGIS